MKGFQGILIAVGLGITGGVCNWFYLERQADKYVRVSFVAIAPGTTINRGDQFAKSHFQEVGFPEKQLGNLELTAVKWDAYKTVIGLRATKNYAPNEILLVQDLKTPARQDLNRLIKDDERVMWIPVDSRTFNASHVNPGDQVSFLVPKLSRSFPTVANGTNDNGNADVKLAVDKSASDIIGPFFILALGDRKGRSDVLKASGGSFGSENEIAIVVKIKGNTLEPKAQQISDIVSQRNLRGVQVLLHPAPKKS